VANFISLRVVLLLIPLPFCPSSTTPQVTPLHLSPHPFSSALDSIPQKHMISCIITDDLLPILLINNKLVDTTLFSALPELALKHFSYEHHFDFTKSLTSGLRKPFPFHFCVHISFPHKFPHFSFPVPTFQTILLSFRVAPIRADSTFLIWMCVSHAYYAAKPTCNLLCFQPPVVFR
jgi:hypothetical protein